MPVNACILIKTTPTSTDEVLALTRKIRGVRKAFIAYGRFDMVAFVRASDYAGIRKLSSEINSLQGVRSTETMVEA